MGTEMCLLRIIKSKEQHTDFEKSKYCKINEKEYKNMSSLYISLLKFIVFAQLL